MKRRDRDGDLHRQRRGWSIRLAAAFTFAAGLCLAGGAFAGEAVARDAFAAGACRPGCAAAARRCRAEVRADLGRELSACRASFIPSRVPSGACAAGAECGGFATRKECTRQGRSFARLRDERCGRLRRRCRECCRAAGRRAACSGASLTVDDPDFRGELGDGALSLSEALSLATGALVPESLSPEERAHLAGTPGAGRADRIRLRPGLVVRLRRVAGPVDSILLPLVDPGDSLNGEGAVIDGRALGDTPQESTSESLAVVEGRFGPISMAPLLVVAASDVELSHLTIVDVPAQAVVVAGSPGGVANVLVHDTAITGPGLDVPSSGIVVVAGGSASDSTLTDVWLRGNHLSDLAQAVGLTAGGATGAAGAADRDRLARIHVAGNVVERASEGISLCGSAATLGAAARENAAEDVEIVRNELRGVLDVSMLVAASCVVEGMSAGGRLERVLVERNSISVPPGLGRQNAALFVAGAQPVLSEAASSTGERVADLTVRANTVDGTFFGFEVVAGYAERCSDCLASGSAIEGVRFEGNSWRNVTIGAQIAAAASVESAGEVSGNALRGVVLSGETFAASLVGLEILGGFTAHLSLGGPFFLSEMEFPGFGLPGQVLGGELEDLAVEDGRIEAPNPVLVSGALGAMSEDLLARDRVRRVAIRRNTLVGGGTEVTVIGALLVGTDDGQARDSSVAGVAVEGNENDAGDPVSVLALDQLAVGAPAASLSGNAVSGVVVR